MDMFSWLADNLATVLISLVLLVIVFFIVRYLLNNRKSGKSSCGGGCAHCAYNGSCHPNCHSKK